VESAERPTVWRPKIRFLNAKAVEVEPLEGFAKLYAGVDGGTSISAGKFSLVIERKSAFSVPNYAISVYMLTAVSWLTFCLDPIDLSSRASVAL
jgi:hypothetical protein